MTRPTTARPVQKLIGACKKQVDNNLFDAIINT